MEEQYFEMIKKSFPDALIEKIDNFDDVYWGWYIVPEVRTIIAFKVLTNDEFFIWIEKYHVWFTSNELKNTRLFCGQIPGDNNSEPDIEFLSKVLNNYALFG